MPAGLRTELSPPAPHAADIHLGEVAALDRDPAREVARETFVAGHVCLPDLTVQSLGTLFDSEPGGVIGADMPRTLRLPNGNVLWTFQDARVRTPNGGARYVHNIGMLQIGRCFSLLVGGSVWAPQAWLFPEHTTPEQRWFWPLDAELGDDGQVYIFAVEMRERGERYLTETVPQGTFVARFNPANWNIEFYGRPANPTTDLYGWSIESDDDWTYLFGHCHRQFGFDERLGVLAHDRECTPLVTVARVPRGRLFDQPEYWDGASWHHDPARAHPIIDREDRSASPTQFVRRNHQWMAITKLDDWWGSEIVVERAVHPVGPWIEIDRRQVREKCVDDCNTYFSSWIEGQNNQRGASPLIASLSHNRWDGAPSWVYRPTFFTVEPPSDQPARAMRCQFGQCT